MVDHVPWRTEMRRRIVDVLTAADGERPTDEEVEAVAYILQHDADLLWMGLAHQGATAVDHWQGYDGRKFERRYERELRQT